MAGLGRSIGARDTAWRHRWVALIAGSSLAAALFAAEMATSPTIALAACHHFTVKASPTSVTEGGKVSITVSRDGSVAPSNVDVSTVDGTAKAGQDYQAFHKTFSFTNQTQMTDTIQTLDDNQAGSDKTFALHLSNPGGCSVNPNYVLDPDVQVTVQDKGTSAVSPPSGAGAAASAPTPVTPTTSAAGPDLTLTVIAVLVLLVSVSGGWLIWRRRSSG